MKKTFDCVEMKRKVQEEVYEQTRRLSRAEEIEYFHAAGEAFWREIDALRTKHRTRSSRRQRAG